MFSLAIAELTGIEIDPATIGGIIVVISTYIVGQGLVDKSVVTAQVAAASDIGRAQVEQYAKNLEDQLTAVLGQLKDEQIVEGLTSAPDIE